MCLRPVWGWVGYVKLATESAPRCEKVRVFSPLDECAVLLIIVGHLSFSRPLLADGRKKRLILRTVFGMQLSPAAIWRIWRSHELL